MTNRKKKTGVKAADKNRSSTAGKKNLAKPDFSTPPEGKLSNADENTIGPLKRLAEHMEEPLFAVSVVAFLAATIGQMFKDIAGAGLILFVAILGIISAYFVYLYFKGETKNYWFLGVPVLIFLTAAFFWYSIRPEYQGVLSRDYSALSLVTATALLFYNILLHKILKPSTAAVSFLLIFALIFHLVPALPSGQTLSNGEKVSVFVDEIDPYFHYRYANDVLNTGNVPDIDHRTYPPKGMDLKGQAFLTSVFMGSLAALFKPMGVTLDDVAIIWPGLFGALGVLLLYLLMRDLFAEMKPYNHIAAIIAAAALIMSPGYSGHSIATNCEDDMLGMFFMLSTFLLFSISLRRKSIAYSLMCGLSMLMLKLTWSGYTYAVVVLGMFAAMYAVVNFIHRKNCAEAVPYLAIPVAASLLSPLILHAQGAAPSLEMPPMFVLVFAAGAVFLSVILEIFRIYGRAIGLMGIMPIGLFMLINGLYAFTSIIPIPTYLIVLLTCALLVLFWGLITLRNWARIGHIAFFSVEILSLIYLLLIYLLYGGISAGFNVHFLSWILAIARLCARLWAFWYLSSTEVKRFYHNKPLTMGEIKDSINKVIVSERIDEKTTGDRIENFITRYIFPIGIIILLLGSGVIILMNINPADYILTLAEGVRVSDIIGLTTAEQATVCVGADGSLDISNCIAGGFSSFGVIGLLGLAMIFVLAYLAIAKRNIGAIFVLAWAVPMIWGFINKSQFQFIASVPITALGATVGLLVGINRKDLEGARVIATAIILFIPLFYIPFPGYDLLGISYGSFEGLTPMHRGGGFYQDRHMWEPALQWMKQADFNGSILTWWDYGHWITAVSGKISIAENTKATESAVQDLAKFHVMFTNETQALEYMKKYDPDYFVVDYTMIGKSGAPHFIARGDFTNQSPQYIKFLQRSDNPNRRGYGSCTFLPPGNAMFRNPDYSTSSVDQNTGRLAPKYEYVGNELVSKLQIVFACGADIAGLIFEIRDTSAGQTMTISVIDRNGAKISWKKWSDMTGASILGIQPLFGDQNRSSILSFAVQHPQANIFPTYMPYRTLVYVPKDFTDYMMTRAYFYDYVDEYKAIGLFPHEVKKLEHIKLEQEFEGGYIKAYKITYPLEETLAGGDGAGINKTLPSKINSTVDEGNATQPSAEPKPEVEGKASEENITAAEKSCIEKYNISKDAVVFYHTQTCPHCQNMMPLVEELEKEGYVFYHADAQKTEGEHVQECFAKQLTGYVPLFMCAGNNETHGGEFAGIDKMRQFAEDCKNAV